MTRHLFAASIFLTISVGWLVLSAPSETSSTAIEGQQVAPIETTPASEAPVTTTLQSAPLMFIENVGQFPDDARFQVRSRNGTIWMVDDALWVTVMKAHPRPSQPSGKEPLGAAERWVEGSRFHQGVNLKLAFVGANPHPRLEPFNRLDAHVSYFIGTHQYPDVPVWGGVRYVDLYPGVNLEITSERNRWTWRAVGVSEEALSQVRLRVEGADALTLDGDRLQVNTAARDFSLPLLQVAMLNGLPVPASQEAHLEDDEIVGPFAAESPKPTDTRSARASAVGDHWGNNPDELVYSTFLGGSENDMGYAIAVNTQGEAYVTGETFSSSFPKKTGAFDPTFDGNRDAFVVRVNDTGTALMYASFLGGTGSEWGSGIALDSAGNAYVTGGTDSSDFPAAAPAFDTSYNGGLSGDAFVVKVNTNGTSLEYATFLGGSDSDNGAAISVDYWTGHAYVAGNTWSSDFPTKTAAYDGSHNGSQDVFVVKVNASGTDLDYATYLGAGDWDEGTAIALHAGSAYVTGWTDSWGFPTTPGALAESVGSSLSNGFLAKLNSAGTDLAYSTLLGGLYEDKGKGIAVDGTGNAYVTGSTSSYNFPTTSGYAYSDQLDAFMVKVEPAGNGDNDLTYGMFLGGTNDDVGEAIAVDGSGAAYITGRTESSDFPTTEGALDESQTGGVDAFAVKVFPDDRGIASATFLGGTSDDRGYGIDIYSSSTKTAYVVGSTTSSHFPTTDGAYDDSHNGERDAFVARLKLSWANIGGFQPNPDGYQFGNWGTPITDTHHPEFLPEDLRQMFGDEAVCVMRDQTCLYRKTVRQWYRKASTMEGGHCEGMAVTSLRFFKEWDDPADFNVAATTTYSLGINDVRRHIAYYHVFQNTDPVKAHKDDVRSNTPSQILNQLKTGMSPSPPVLFVRPRKGSGGHTVTPYAIENQGSGVYRIMVYDSNHPNSSKYVEIDTNNDTWNYPALGWSGEAISHTLGLVPLNLYAQDPECPWDQESSGIQSNGSPTGQVWLTGPGHLLITDAQGRRIGYVGNQFVDEVPGAYGGVIDGGLGVETEPIYTLPLTDTYTIMLDGQTLQQTGTAAVMQFGPGYAVGAENVTLGPTSQDLLTIAPDGTQVSLQASSDKEATLVLAIDETDLSHEFQVSGVDIGTGQSITWRADLPSGSLVLDNSQNKGGEYDLEITWVDTTDEYEFAHNDIAIAAGDTHYFDYGNLDGGNLTLEIDEGSDGSIDETRELPNINLSQVLFDEAHEEQNTIDWARAQEIVPDHPEWVYFGQLSRTLAGEFTLERNPDAPLTHQLLQDYDALILAAPQSEFTSGEIRAIRQFVSNGGGLIVLGSCGLDHPANALLSDYEISFDPHCIWAPIPDLEGDFPVTNFASHPAVAGVSSFTTNWAQSLLFGSGATYLAWTGTDAWQDTNWNDTCDPGDDPTGPFTIVAGYDTGYGRVAAVSDDSFQDDGFEWRGNVTLMRALLRWVTGGQEREFMFVYVPLVLREHR